MKRFFSVAAVVVAVMAATVHAAPLPVVVLGAGEAQPVRTPWCQEFDRALSADTLYLVTGLYYVESGFSLTIEPGTVIMGDSETGGTLIVTRGAQIFAQGTQQKPIVFTSEKAIGNRNPGDWGGVIILGAAPVNKVNPLIEGGLIAGSCGGGSGTYGGSNPSDNSGVLSYVRIEFAGYRFQVDNEVNGLSLGGVGSGTQIDHVQVSYSNDDSYECFGGTVNCNYLVAFGGTDDEFDSDFGYRGKMQFGFGLRDPDYSDPTGQSNGYESDNDGSSSSTATPYTKPTYVNFTLVGPERTDALVGTWIGTYEYSAVLRRSTQTSIYNSVIMGYPWGLSIRDATTQGFASGDSLQIRNTHIQATLKPSGSTHIHDETRWANVDTWFTTGSFNNVGLAQSNPSSVGLTDMSTLSAPDPRPALGSPLIGTADFSNPRLAGCVVTNYKGAFDPALPLNQQWTYYWTNFDPQNTDYAMGLPTAVGDGPGFREYLSQNYPNPFNPQTSIDFVVPTTGNVTLEVFDVAGAKVATLFNGVKTAGSRNTVSFNADGLASGVYFYRLRGNGFTEMRKMVLLK
jgi:hypothetical protein